MSGEIILITEAEFKSNRLLHGSLIDGGFIMSTDSCGAFENLSSLEKIEAYVCRLKRFMVVRLNLKNLPSF